MEKVETINVRTLQAMALRIAIQHQANLPLHASLAASDVVVGSKRRRRD